MQNQDWKSILGEAFNIESSDEEPLAESQHESKSTALEQQGKKMIDIILDKKGRKGKTATIIANLELDEDNLKQLAADLKRACGVGGSARGGEILIQGDKRDKVLSVLTTKGFKARII